MDDFELRQIALMRQFIDDYKSSAISLNVFVQKIEALISVLGIGEFSARADPITMGLEVINATLLNEDRGPTDDENRALNRAISDLEGLLNGCASR